MKNRSLSLSITAIALTFACLLSWDARAEIRPTLINGTAVPKDTWTEVVYISSSGGSCSATLVGPKVIITAAHCGTTGTTVRFSVAGKSYTAKLTRSTLYPGRDHDISLGLVNEEVTGIQPKTIGGTATRGLEITLLGYGCINSAGTGGNDGILRIGKSVVTGFSGYDMVSSTPGGAALCFGDSGGPAFVANNGEEGALLIGINSKGNISDTNYNTRLDSTESQTFLKNYASSQKVDICGVNKDCASIPDPQTPAPTCVLTANPQTVFSGESVTLSLATTNATTASIDGTNVSVPNGQKNITTSSLGNFNIVARVEGKGGTAQCTASYTVNQRDVPPPNRPTCTLSAVPQEVRIGETVSLELVAQGQPEFASIDGTSVTVPSGKKLVTAKMLGDFSATGFVRGSSGSNNCFADYRVVDGTAPPPTTPSYSLTASACGANLLAASGVRDVCMGVVKKSDAAENLRIQTVLMVNFTDGTREVMPVLSTKTLSTNASTQMTEEMWTLYTNKSVASQNYQVLDTKTATATKRADGTYVTIEGRSSTGRYFLVDKLGATVVR